MNQILRCDWLPESYLTRSGLPTASRKKNFPESHVINPLLTKLVPSRWLDIGLALFFFFASLWTPSRFINTQEMNLANIQQSWPHTWSITHISSSSCFVHFSSSLLALPGVQFAVFRAAPQVTGRLEGAFFSLWRNSVLFFAGFWHETCLEFIIPLDTCSC